MPEKKSGVLQHRQAADGNDPAFFCPASTAAYMRGNNIASWEDDPFMAHGRWILAPICPPQAWKRAKTTLDLDDHGLFNALFGETAALVALRDPRESGVVVVSRAPAKLLKRLPSAFGLTKNETQPDQGVYRYYELREGDVRLAVAIGKRWFMLTSAKHVGDLKTVVAGALAPSGENCLGRAPEYRQLLAQLPSERRGLGFARDRKRPCHHAIALVREENDLVVHYAATDPIPEEAKYPENVPKEVEHYLSARYSTPDTGPDNAAYPHLSHTDGVSFGPLPSSVIAVASLNLMHHCPRDLGPLDLPVIFGSVRERILPGISPPELGFIAAVDVEQPSAKRTISAPVAGLAVRLDNPAIAADLDRLLRTLHLLATLGSFELGKTLFGIDSKKEGETEFKVADFGAALVRWIKDPGVAALVNLPDPAGLRRITFGRIGEWYIICSQEAFFRQCVRAHADPSLLLSASTPYQAFGLESRKDLLLNALAEAPRLSGLLSTVTGQLREQKDANAAARNQSAAQSKPNTSGPPKPKECFSRLDDAMHRGRNILSSVANYWYQVHVIPSKPPVAKENKTIAEARKAGKNKTPLKTNPDRALKPLKWLSDTIRQRHSFSLQIWRGPDGSPRGRLRVVGNPTETAALQEPAESSARPSPKDSQGSAAPL